MYRVPITAVLADPRGRPVCLPPSHKGSSSGRATDHTPTAVPCESVRLSVRLSDAPVLKLPTVPPPSGSGSTPSAWPDRHTDCPPARRLPAKRDLFHPFIFRVMIWPCQFDTPGSRQRRKATRRILYISVLSNVSPLRKEPIDPLCCINSIHPGPDLTL